MLKPMSAGFFVRQKLFVQGAAAALLAALVLGGCGAPAPQVAIAAESTMHTQRLAKATLLAMQGNAAAFEQLKQSRDRLAAFLMILRYGGEYEGRQIDAASGDRQAAMAPLLKEWETVDKKLTLLIEQKALLAEMGKTFEKLNMMDSTLYTLGEEVAALALQTGSAQREAAAAVRLSLLTQRIGKHASQLLVGSTVNPETAFMLGKDIEVFRALIGGLMNGSEELHLAPLKGEAREKLVAISSNYAEYRASLDWILANLGKIVAVKTAALTLPAQLDVTFEQLRKLQGAYAKED